MAYLGYRAPLPVWSSPGIIMPPQNFGDMEDKRLQFTARFLEAVLIYKSQLDEGLVQVEVSGKEPMDMIQYFRLFGATRLPGSTRDTQRFCPQSHHFLLLHQGNVCFLHYYLVVSYFIQCFHEFVRFYCLPGQKSNAGQFLVNMELEHPILILLSCMYLGFVHLWAASNRPLRATWAKTAAPTWFAAELRYGRWGGVHSGLTYYCDAVTTSCSICLILFKVSYIS